MKKKQQRTPPVREINPQAPIFGDATGGRCEPVREEMNHRLRRLYSEDTEVWSSYELGKPVYCRVEMRYRRKLYVGIGDTEALAWRDLRTLLPRIEQDLDFHIIGVREWFIIYLYTEYGDWRCEGSQPLVVMEKLLKCAKRARPTICGQ